MHAILIGLLHVVIYISVCDQFHWGENCMNDCNCGPGSDRCDPVDGCVCKSGWQGTECDADINECNTVNSPCDTEGKQKCVNTAGSYVCQCQTGYHNVSGVCQSKFLLFKYSRQNTVMEKSTKM